MSENVSDSKKGHKDMKVGMNRTIPGDGWSWTHLIRVRFTWMIAANRIRKTCRESIAKNPKCYT